jgi:hypothetical protein
MAQFDVYPGPGAGAEFLVDLQDAMLKGLVTRVVAPLAAAADVDPPMRILNPVVQVDGRSYVLQLHLMAAISTRHLGKPVASIKSLRKEIVAGIDLLFTGI